MTPAERYLLLGLQLGRHVDGLVDAYYGPDELAGEVAAVDPVAPVQLVADADALRAEAGDSWLGDQLGALATWAGIVAGDRPAYADEMEACFGVRPTRWDEDAYRAAHERLDTLLPPGGSLTERLGAWRAANLVPNALLVPLLREVVQEVRGITRDLIGLPEGEGLVVEEVRDEPWTAFNYYLGGFRSRVVVNADRPTTFDDLIELAAHEAYPGHHTEGCAKETELVHGRGLVEHTIMLTPTPQSLIAEGIAGTAMEVLGDPAREAIARVLHAHGIEHDGGRAGAIREAAAPLRRVRLDAALLVHEDGATEGQAVDHLMRWGLLPREQAARGALFFAPEAPWRTFVITYFAGSALVGAFHRNDPERFARLLREQVRVRDLVEAAGEAAA